jgi:uncharacterized protein YjbI with pentapeptide repeats
MGVARPWLSRLAGTTVLFAGKHEKRSTYETLATVSGGKVVEEITSRLTYLVLLATGGTRARVKQAAELNRNGASIVTLELSDFLKLLAPTREEAQALLRGDAADHQQWNALAGGTVPRTDLSGADLRGLKFRQTCHLSSHVFFSDVKLEGSDLSGSELRHLGFGELRQVNLEDVDFQNGIITHMTDCKCKNADMSGVQTSPSGQTRLVRCDFAGARMYGIHGPTGMMTDCDFFRTVLTKAYLRGATFTRCNLSGADLGHANLTLCDLSDCKLAGANLSRADLTGAKLKRVDFTGADLSGAWLFDADFTDAIIDDADFSKAKFRDTVLTGLEPALARHFDPNDPTVIVHPGPSMIELEKRASPGNFVFAITVDWKDRQILLTVDCTRYGTLAYDNDASTLVPGGSGAQNKPLGDQMLFLADRYRGGKPRQDSITIKSGKTAVKNETLRRLVLAAWGEAFGV